MVFIIDDKLISEKTKSYKRKIQDTNFFNLDRKIGLERSNYLQNQHSNKQAIINGIERFFGVYGIIKEYAAKYGPNKFSENYGLFCGSVYSDSLLEEQTDSVLNISRIGKLPVGKDECILINDILASYVNIISRATNKNLPKLTRGFFQSITYSTKESLKEFKQSLKELSKEEIKIGDISFRGFDYNLGNLVLQESIKNEDLQTIEPIKDYEKVNFDDIGGNYFAKEAAKRIIKEIKNPKIRSFYGRKKSKGLILYGPPGTGKTMLAKAIATEIDKPFYEVRVEQILDKWLGNSEKQLANLLDKKDVIFFFDEMDSLGAKKGDNDGKVIDRIVNLISTKMDGLGSDDSNTYIAATNNPILIDQKLIRRFNRPIYVGIPNKLELQKILEKQINSFKKRSDAWNSHKINVFKGIQLDNIEACAYEKSLELQNSGLVGIVGSDIEEIINRAIERAEIDAYNGNVRLLDTEDFISEISDFKKISPWINAYEESVINE